MADCERLQTCPFFTGQMTNMPSTADLIKESFCRGAKTQCARYQVASSGLPTPVDLYPNDVDRAREILRKR